MMVAAALRLAPARAKAFMAGNYFIASCATIRRKAWWGRRAER